MRRLTKHVVPLLLATNAAKWLMEYLDDPSSNTRKYRYRATEIKEALREETGWKCVYCESKIGHNTPGDVEHKVPSSKNPSLHFEWSNLTTACTECNRRKNDYYEKVIAFLDPYTDDVEEMLVHLGPIVYWRPGDERAEATVRTLELDTMARKELFQQKCDLLEKARNLLELVTQTSGPLRELREDELRRMQDARSEYSAAIRSYVVLAMARVGSSSA
jgi:uncharacterized protein (TIGR02646 family)